MCREALARSGRQRRRGPVKFDFFSFARYEILFVSRCMKALCVWVVRVSCVVLPATPLCTVRQTNHQHFKAQPHTQWAQPLPLLAAVARPARGMHGGVVKMVSGKRKRHDAGQDSEPTRGRERVAARDASGLVQVVTSRLQASACAATKQWMENYVKGTPCRGNKAPECRKALQDALSAFAPANASTDPLAQKDRGSMAAAGAGAQTFALQALADAACSLVQSPFGDDKFTGILLLAEFVIVDKRARTDPTAAAVLYTDAFLARILYV